MIDEFSLGFFQFFESLKSWRQDRRLISMSLIPWAIFVVLFLVGAIFAAPYFSALSGYMASWGALGGVLGVILLLFAWLIFAVSISYVIYLIGAIIASPFHSLIADRALILSGHQGSGQSLAYKLRLMLSMLWVTLIKSVLFLFIGLILLALSFIPMLAPVVSFIAVLIMAFDCSDFAFEVFEMNLRDRLSFFTKHLIAYSGLATLISMTILVPGLFFVLLPIFVVAASQLTYRLKSRGI